MDATIKEKYLIWTAVGLAICIISLGVTIIIGSDFGHDNFVRLIVFVCSNVFGWLFYLAFQSFIFDAYHIYRMKFGKKDMPKEIETKPSQEIIVPLAEDTETAKEVSDEKIVQESQPVEIHINSQQHQERVSTYEELQKQEMENGGVFEPVTIVDDLLLLYFRLFLLVFFRLHCLVGYVVVDNVFLIIICDAFRLFAPFSVRRAAGRGQS